MLELAFYSSKTSSSSSLGGPSLWMSDRMLDCELGGESGDELGGELEMTFSFYPSKGSLGGPFLSL